MKISLSPGFLLLLAGSQAAVSTAVEEKTLLRRGSTVAAERKLADHPHTSESQSFPGNHHPMQETTHQARSNGYKYPPQNSYAPPKAYGYGYGYEDPKPTPVPTPRPTPRPTPDPTPRPTPSPTRPPTERPTTRPTTLRPTPQPTPQPTHSPTPRPTTAFPSPAPSPAPSPSPTQEPSSEPSPAPSPEPSSSPSGVPSANPTISSAPSSNEPTTSQEPSENPTQSAEPSENPTQSAEPSENPTQSAEPSENPTQSAEPSANPTIDSVTIAQFVCAPENEDELGVLCELIQANPLIFNLLDDNLINIPRTQLDALEAILAGAIDTAINVPGLPDFEFLEGLNDLPGINRGIGGRKLQQLPDLTLFAPNNEAFVRLLQREINALFDLQVPEVVAYFNALGVDFLENSVLVNEFFLGPNGNLFLTEILLTHVVGQELSERDLKCSRIIQMLNGEETATECRRVANTGRVKKFQVGGGNTVRNLAKIINPDNIASNGVVHIVNNVILPDFRFPDIPDIEIFIPQPIFVVQGPPGIPIPDLGVPVLFQPQP